MALKICHVANYYPGVHDYWGGAEQACKTTVDLLAQENIEQAVITLKADNQLEIGASQYELSGMEMLFGGRLKNILNGIKVILFPFDPLVYLRCLRLFREIEPDVVHCHNFKFHSLAVIAAARKRGIPVVLSIYDYWFFCPKDNLHPVDSGACRKNSSIQCLSCYQPKGKPLSPAAKLPLLFRQRILNRYLRQVQGFIALSKASKRILKSNGINGELVRVIHQYFNFESREDRSLEPAPGTILFAGWLSPNKGAHVIVEAAGLVVKKHPEVRFLMAGDKGGNETYYRNLVKRIEELGLADKVDLLGKKPHGELQQLLQTSEIMVIPEQWENMSPIILIEAMAWGKPIVASSIGGIPEFIKDGESGLTAAPDSPDSFAENISFLLENKDEALKMGRAARRDVATLFDPEVFKSRTIALYRELSA